MTVLGGRGDLLNRAAAAVLRPHLEQQATAGWWARLPPFLARAVYVSAGVATVVLTRTTAKAALTPVVPMAMRLLPHRVRLCVQPPVASATLGQEPSAARGAASKATMNVVAASSDEGGGKGFSPQLQSRFGDCRLHPAFDVAVLPAGDEEGLKKRLLPPGILLKSDGYPCDADAIRRFLTFGLMVVALVVYCDVFGELTKEI